jgi:hypothetical protein
MKLKFELVNGYGILVDEEAEIKAREKYLLIPESQIKNAENDLPKNKRDWVKIIFAEPELNLEGVPTFEWREIVMFQKANLWFDEMEKQNKIAYPPSFIDGYKSNPAKYTEEDIERAFIVGLNCSQEISLKGLPTDEGLDYQYKKLNQLIQSLQKYPEYVVMENNTIKKLIW